MNYKLYDQETGFYQDMPQHGSVEPFSKRRRIDQTSAAPSLSLVMPQPNDHMLGLGSPPSLGLGSLAPPQPLAPQMLTAPIPDQLSLACGDIWRPFLGGAMAEYQDYEQQQLLQQQDRLLGFMLKGEQQEQMCRDSRQLHADLPNGLHLTKL